MKICHWEHWSFITHLLLTGYSIIFVWKSTSMNRCVQISTILHSHIFICWWNKSPELFLYNISGHLLWWQFKVFSFEVISHFSKWLKCVFSLSLFKSKGFNGFITLLQTDKKIAIIKTCTIVITTNFTQFKESWLKALLWATKDTQPFSWSVALCRARFSPKLFTFLEFLCCTN